MTAEFDTRTVDLKAGEVALCVQPSGQRVVEVLPDAAFENLLLVTTDGNLRLIERAVEAHGGDPRRVGVVPVTGTAVDYDGPLWATDRVSPSDLTGVSIQFSKGFEHVQPDEGWVAVDSLGVLAMYASTERLFRLLDAVVGAVRGRNARAVLSTAEGVLGDQAMRQFRGLADEEVNFASRR